MANLRMRRKRRQAKAVMRHGRTAAPTHKLQSGRTGQVRHKRLKSLRG